MNEEYFKDFPTIKSAEEFFEQATEHHLQWMKSLKDPNPLWMIYLKDGGYNIVEIVGKPQDNHSPLDQVGSYIIKLDPDAYIVFSEGWCKIFKNQNEAENFERNGEYGSISKMPDKVEVVTAFGRSKDGKHEFTRLYYIKRNKSNRIIDFVEEKGGELESKKLP